jgi:hypothetical protein
MITSIVFSKNRPLQLDLCLNSMKKNLPECSRVIVIHKNSEEFASAHDTLKTEHPDVTFWEQGESLFRDTLESVISADTDYIGYFTDDGIVFSDEATYYKHLDSPEVACVSLRMGLNICKRSHGNETCEDGPAICTHLSGGGIGWSKTSMLYSSYWSYSLSVDGHVFRQRDMIEMLDELCYLEDRQPERWKQTPNELEGALQRFWTTTPNCIVSPTHSRVVNSPNNKVQHSHNNASGLSHNYSAEYLLGKYMSGSRINLDHLDFSNIKCPHTEIDLVKGLS